MKTYCNYHPLAPSRWYCGECFGHFCGSCVPTLRDSRRGANCPRCQKPLDYLGASNLAQPFWNRISTFFRYPFAKGPVALFLLCTLGPVLFQGPLISLVVGLFLAAVQVRYLYAIIEATAEGKMDPPAFSSAFQGGGLSLLLQQFLMLFGAIFFVAFVMHSAGPMVGLMALAFTLLVIPAAVLILAMERSSLAALNPLRQMAVIGAIGWPYFVLYGYLVLMILSLGVVTEFVVTHFDPLLGYPLLGFASTYFMVVIFHMLGYLLYQYQYELGFSADSSEEDVTSVNSETLNVMKQAADIDIALKEGEYEKAASLLFQDYRRRPHDLNQLDRLVRLLMALKSTKSLRELVRPALKMLMGQSRWEEISTLLKLLYQEDDYHLTDPQLAFEVAQGLHHLGKHKLVLRLLKDLHKEHPDFVSLPEAYLLVAKTLANGFKDKVRASKYLEFVRRKYPEHHIQSRLEHYRESLRLHGMIP